MGVPVKKTSGKKKPARAPQQLTAEEHFENAEMAFMMDNLDQARRSFKRALDMEPENIEFLEGYGSFLAECGPQQEAVTVLQRAVQLQPDEGFEKYMYLGQLLEESGEAEQAVRKGISILRAYMQEQAQQPAPAEGSEEAAEAAEVKEHLDSTLASCLCSLVEVLMNRAQQSDAGVASVEAECEQLLGESRALAPSSPEPLQALASLRQQQDKDEEALALLRQSLALWFKPPKDEEEAEEGGEAKPKAAAKEGAAAAAGDDDDDDEDLMDLEDIEDELPSFEFRFETAKLLLELDDSVDTASQVLEQLLEENDQDPNVWLLLAMCCQGGGDLEGALGAVEEGIDLCKKLGLPSDDETLAGFEAMQTELKQMLDSEQKKEEDS